MFYLRIYDSNGDLKSPGLVNFGEVQYTERVSGDATKTRLVFDKSGSVTLDVNLSYSDFSDQMHAFLSRNFNDPEYSKRAMSSRVAFYIWDVYETT